MLGYQLSFRSVDCLTCWAAVVDLPSQAGLLILVFSGVVRLLQKQGPGCGDVDELWQTIIMSCVLHTLV